MRMPLSYGAISFSTLVALLKQSLRTSSMTVSYSRYQHDLVAPQGELAKPFNMSPSCAEVKQSVEPEILGFTLWKAGFVLGSN